MTSKNCVLCLDTTTRKIKVFGRRGRSLKIPEKISQHFRFPVDPSNKRHQDICINCWRKTKLFNEFYDFVWEAHLKIPIKNAVVLKTDFTPKEHCNAPIGSISDSVRIKKKNGNSDIPIEFQTVVQTKTEIKESSTSITEHQLNQPDSASDDDRDAKTNPTDVNADPDESELEGKISEYFLMNCDLCSEQLQSMDNIQQHFKMKHDINRGFLRCCNKKFNMRKGIIDHVRWHIDPNAFKCTTCLKTFNEKRRLTAHIASHHMGDEKLVFSCQLCEKRFSKKHILNEHMKRVHPPVDQMFTCGFCQKEYKTKKLVHNHMQAVHNAKDTKHICYICAKVLSSKHSLKEHLNIHSECQRVKCDECGAMLKSESILIKHKKMHTDEEQTCDICFKIKPTRSALRNHKNNVHGVAKHKCNFCDKSFRRLVSLREHVATHTGESLYKCPYCPITFKSNSNMFKHLKHGHRKEWMAKKSIKEESGMKSRKFHV